MADVGGFSARTVCARALILVLLCLAWMAGKEGISNLYVHSANREINRWATPGQRVRGEDWTRVMRDLTESLRYSPNNAWALEAMGAFQLRRKSAATDPALAAAAVRSANTYLHLTLIERPTTPTAWAYLALSEFHLHDLDEDLFAALRHADELGPWEPEVQYLVIFVGLAAWDKLGADQRAAMVRTLERAMRQNASKVTELVKSFNRFDLLCDIKDGKLKMERSCGRLQKSQQRSNRR